MRLDEIVEINPVEKLKKDTYAKKISMDKLRPYCRDIAGYTIEKYMGGSKFRNGDTLMARITPCLENGKIAKVSGLKEGEIGFGSTEFIVFREIKSISDADYIYYLISSPMIREIAIKSMVGSSGRQRVQLNVLRQINVNVPSYKKQIKIGKILKLLDDKIKNNDAINNNL
ncbi:MAG: restriction endonuclease subunit S, partial [Clostridium sp.]|nr:restriction endonuclease subunit S [Clostridium sp.]